MSYENYGGCPPTNVGKLTPTSNGIPYPCYTCENHCRGKSCKKWDEWYKGKWNDFRTVAGVKQFNV